MQIIWKQTEIKLMVHQADLLLVDIRTTAIMKYNPVCSKYKLSCIEFS